MLLNLPPRHTWMTVDALCCSLAILRRSLSWRDFCNRSCLLCSWALLPRMSTLRRFPTSGNMVLRYS